MASACYELLQILSRRSFPAVVFKPEDIHQVLALRSAVLIEAETAMPVFWNGERRIERAEVTAIRQRFNIRAFAQKPNPPTSIRSHPSQIPSRSTSSETCGRPHLCGVQDPQNCHGAC